MTTTTMMMMTSSFAAAARCCHGCDVSKSDLIASDTFHMSDNMHELTNDDNAERCQQVCYIIMYIRSIGEMLSIADDIACVVGGIDGRVGRITGILLVTHTVTGTKRCS